ncbi:MAG: hypothetical protein FHK82_04965 [Sedimenticola thiotaurini]|uniref:Uncharacterized protein n=1 Tax=Sedimenticola thiotaurini TaxID=1543721 RepID=A0A558DAL4_9GAMM|nr:MAG: hypothetical protein FHK82_04965 [Sedimenticola thiotaurini]
MRDFLLRTIAEETSLVMGGLKENCVLDAVLVVPNRHKIVRRIIPVVNNYQSGSASMRVVRVVFSSRIISIVPSGRMTEFSRGI